MKFNTFSNKNLLKIIMILFLVSFTFSTKNVYNRKGKTSYTSRGKALPDEFEANLEIENTTKKTNQSIKVKLTKKSMEAAGSGFELSTDSTTNEVPPFVKVKNGVYFLNYRIFAKGFNCNESGWFSKNSITFFVSYNGDSISLNFKFPKSYVLWDSVKNEDLNNLCNKMYNNFNDYSKKLSDSKDSIIKSVTIATDLEKEKLKNIQSKDELDNFINSKKEEKTQLLNQLKTLNDKKNSISDDLKKIDLGKINKQKDYENVNLDITVKQQVAQNYQDIIEEKTKASNSIKQITDQEINDRYNQIKTSVDILSEIFLSTDPYYQTLKTLSADVKVNKDKIIPALK